MLFLAAKSLSSAPPVSFLLSFFYTLFLQKKKKKKKNSNNRKQKLRTNNQNSRNKQVIQNLRKRGDGGTWGDICVDKNTVVLVDQLCASWRKIIDSLLTVR